MENEFLDKVKDNAAVRIWSEKTQLEKGDSLAERRAFIPSPRPLLEPYIHCFTFGKVDLVPTVEEYVAVLHCSKEEDIEWRAPLLVPDKILYRCGSFDWVPLLGIWGAMGILLWGDNYKKRVKEISNAWNQTRRMKRLAVGSMTTLEYNRWLSKRINDNIPRPSLKGVRPMEEYLQVIPSKLENIKQGFEQRNLELEKRIE
ncbi:hypothetical protein J1N35_005465 [Gossypium stocksii]|uniref:Uncharacterized protein n=1 Tax=Gossypium stocksii TaxID=47602 RepID=A0A9D3WFC5_9ROSI|nr:hypothetical protein J1N35_005465 [Gossypium stocksii]